MFKHVVTKICQKTFRVVNYIIPEKHELFTANNMQYMVIDGLQ